jgi:hypothetical protein
MRSASLKISPSVFPKILALVMFGDRGMRDMTITQFPPALQAKLFENCAPRDPVSLGMILNLEDRSTKLRRLTRSPGL